MSESGPNQPAKPRIVLVDHGTGNLTSLERALDLGGAEVVRTSSPASLASADAVVLPGVGAFPAAMNSLRRLGFAEAIRQWAADGRPLLGVCLGMQLLFEGSDEAGGAEGLSLIEGRVRKLDARGERLPHIGWTEVTWVREHPLRAGISQPTALYHVHSFVCDPTVPEVVLATAEHGEAFTTAVGSGGTVGVQFHPEKSSTDGLRMVANFVSGVAAKIEP